jgi:hypothetical protein
MIHEGVEGRGSLACRDEADASLACEERSMSIFQGLASDNANNLYAAWKGETGDDRLFCAVFNGTIWQSRPMIPGNSSTGPSLAFLNGKLFAAWKGEHDDKRLFYSRLERDGWNSPHTIPGNSDFGPSLVTLNGKMYAAWKGEADLRLFYAEFDGTWLPQVQMTHNGSDAGFASCIGPSLGVFNGTLYATWRGAIADQFIYYASFDGSRWSAPNRLPGAEQSSTGPSIAQFGSNLYVITKGSGADERLFLGWFDAEMTWHVASGPITEITCNSSIGAALSTFGNNLFAIWKGPDSDQQIYCGSFDGSNWSAQPNIPGNTGQDMATMPYAGLGSGSNYILSTNGDPITALSVNIDVTQEIVSDVGFGFQLNCYTTQNEYSAWQQYILCYDPSQAFQFAGQVDNWTTTAEILNSGLIWFCPIEGPTPAGTVFGITLSFHASSQKVIGAKFTATLPGKPQASVFIALRNLNIDNAGPKEELSQMSPIVAFQLDFVGKDGTIAVLTSGAGTITYTTSPALTALPDFPRFVEYDEPTGEGANSVYSSLPLGSRTTFTQSFATAAT